MFCQAGIFGSLYVQTLIRCLALIQAFSEPTTCLRRSCTMNSPNRRSLEVDFFRGVVLLVIAIDHISGSTLSKFTLHAYAFCDSAEVFVFLGGYASAAAYTAVLSRKGAPAARRRFLRRSYEIYRAYLFTAVLMLLGGALMMLLRIDSPMLQYTEWPSFLARPFKLALDVALLRHQPYL